MPVLVRHLPLFRSFSLQFYPVNYSSPFIARCRPTNQPSIQSTVLGGGTIKHRYSHPSAISESPAGGGWMLMEHHHPISHQVAHDHPDLCDNSASLLKWCHCYKNRDQNGENKNYKDELDASPSRCRSCCFLGILHRSLINLNCSKRWTNKNSRIVLSDSFFVHTTAALLGLGWTSGVMRRASRK